MRIDHGTVFTIDDLAAYLKISKSTLYKLAQGGSLPGQKVGKHWRFHKDAIDQWLMQRLENHTTERVNVAVGKAR